MTCPCRPWREIIAAVEGDVVAMGLPAEMGESSLLQLLGKGCIFQCPEHKGYLVAEKSVLMVRAEMFRQSAVKCPLCFEGRELDRCGWCDFGGNPDGSVCGHCTDGHIPGGPCGLCKGLSYVTYQQLILEEARRGVEADARRNDSFSPLRSMALWAELRRHLRPVIAGAMGVSTNAIRTENGGMTYSPYPPTLLLLDVDGNIQVELRGINWGYFGSAPRALAVILSDALPEKFESFDAAYTFATAIPQEDSWRITTQQ